MYQRMQSWARASIEYLISERHIYSTQCMHDVYMSSCVHARHCMHDYWLFGLDPVRCTQRTRATQVMKVVTLRFSQTLQTHVGLSANQKDRSIHPSAHACDTPNRLERIWAWDSLVGLPGCRNWSHALTHSVQKKQCLLCERSCLLSGKTSLMHCLYVLQSLCVFASGFGDCVFIYIFSLQYI